MTDEKRLILVRFSPELTTKARGTRQRFTKRLVGNMAEALRSINADFHIETQWTRLFVRTSAPDAVETLARVPGISSLSLVERETSADLDEIVEAGAEAFGDRVRGHSYAVRARRTGRHRYTSGDIQNRLGAALNPGARVDLTNPDVEVHVEVRDEAAWLFSGRIEGLGGLPIGTEGRAICLISGGFDSVVAAWLMLKRGVMLDYVFCNLAGDAYERSVVQVTKILADHWSYGYTPRIHVLDFHEPLDAIRAEAHPRFWQLVLKRLMYRAAAQIADQQNSSAIVTGESIGQVSSQTLPNLRAIEQAVEIPVLRPLLVFDKKEIVELTRRIGTYEISSRVKEYCAIAPGNPVTRASARAAAEEESGIDLAMLSRITNDRKILDLKELTVADLVTPYVFADEVPSDAVVIDVRTEPEWETWHYPGAIRRDVWEMGSTYSKLDRDRKYLIYCGVGLQAAHLAEEMQKAGFEAYAFRGGLKKLRENV